MSHRLVTAAGLCRTLTGFPDSPQPRGTSELRATIASRPVASVLPSHVTVVGVPADGWPGLGDPARALLSEAGEVRAVGALFAGRAIAMLTRDENSDLYWVLRPDGSLIHKVIIPRAERWAIAENRGTAVIRSDEGNLVVVDLRYGRVQSEAAPPFAVADLDVDSDGQYVALAGEPDATGTPDRKSVV